MKSWQLAGGEAQLDFQGAASRTLKTGKPALCPVCGSQPLRFYYHALRKGEINRAVLWVWCVECGTWDHLARLKPLDLVSYKDPFESLTADEFASMERGEKAAWIERLDQLWASEKISRVLQ